MPSCYHQAYYKTSATNLAELPIDTGIEVAFAGRSNAGKSSAINTITEQKSLARISKTPGRTRMINFFEFAPNRALVDLPGYGYASVPQKIKVHWQYVLESYLETRCSLRGLMLIVDTRQSLKTFDIQIVSWANNAKLPVHILLTKADKLKRAATITVLQQVSIRLKSLNLTASAQLLSSLKKTGKQEAIDKLDSWFATDS